MFFATNTIPASTNGDSSSCSPLLCSAPPQTNNSINAIPLLHIYEITRLAQLTPHSHLHSTSRIDSLLPTKMKHQTLTNALMMTPIHVLVVSWFQTNKKPLRIRPNHLRSGRWGVIDKCKLLVMRSTWRMIERKCVRHEHRHRQCCKLRREFGLGIFG